MLDTSFLFLGRGVRKNTLVVLYCVPTNNNPSLPCTLRIVKKKVNQKLMTNKHRIIIIPIARHVGVQKWFVNNKSPRFSVLNNNFLLFCNDNNCYSSYS